MLKHLFGWGLECHRLNEQEPDPALLTRGTVRIRESGSVPKCHGFGTLELTDLLLRKMRVDFKSMEEEMDQLAGMLPSCTDHTV
jgi:hypothetical protein